MNDLQKMGGISAFIAAALYVLGIVYFIFVLDFPATMNPGQNVLLLIENKVGMQAVSLLIYVIFGVFLVILNLALYQQLKAVSPALIQTATAFGLIWAGLVIASGMIFNLGIENVIELYAEDPGQAATVWLAVNIVHEGIGGGNEIVGGLWLLLLSWAALKTEIFPKLLNFLGLLAGAAGVISAIPIFADVGGAIFGLSQIIWFLWLGIILLKTNQS